VRRELPKRVGDVLTREQIQEVIELGIYVDRDHEGVLLQIFTMPIGDRATLFFEIIQRIGCMHEAQVIQASGAVETVIEQMAGCGGFGKGNTRELYQSIERGEEAMGAR
jgi:4-hydroxyphenylpyruvate dioxygenase